MNRITRVLLISGLGLVTGITIGAGPAMAATNTGQGAVQSSTTASAARPGDQVENYFDSRDGCEVAGRIGERLGRWDDYDCVLVRGGFHEGDWALVVDENDWHHGHGWHHGHHWHHGFPHGGFPHGGFPHGGFPHGGVPHHPIPIMGGHSHNNAGMPTRGKH